MKTVFYTENVAKIINVAAENKSVIAQFIKEKLDSKAQSELKNNINYIDVKKVGRDDGYDICFTGCKKDLESSLFPDHTPDAMWRYENREDLRIETLPSMWKDYSISRKEDKITDLDVQYFNDILPLPKLHISIGNTFNDFYKAYFVGNYSSFHVDSSLHNSCMRNDVKASKAADFYSNFANAKILTVQDDMGYIYARSIVWENVILNRKSYTLMDRVYYVSRGVLTMIYKFAEEQGWARKTINSFDSKKKISIFNGTKWEEHDYVATYKINNYSQDFKSGCPYLDTFSYLKYDYKNNKLFLSNIPEDDEDTSVLATCTSTGGFADFKEKLRICPVCGGKLESGDKFCSKCMSKLTSWNGVLITTGMTVKNGIEVPNELLDGIPDDYNPESFSIVNGFINKIYNRE